MRSGTCQRCGGDEVYAGRNVLDEHTEQAVKAHIEPGFRGMRPQLRTDIWTYACATCGLLETYLVDPEALAFVRSSWLRVPKAAPAPS
jgi:hypothetical protein